MVVRKGISTEFRLRLHCHASVTGGSLYLGVIRNLPLIKVGSEETLNPLCEGGKA